MADDDKRFKVIGWDPATTQLSLRHGPDGRRFHTLDEQPIQRGDHLELLLPRGVWIRGTYDWAQDVTDDSYEPSRPPILSVILGGPWETNEAFEPPRVQLYLPRDAVLRHLRTKKPRNRT